MIFKLRIEELKDKTKKIKRAMMVTLDTKIEGIGVLNAIGELDKGSPLQKEVDFIIKEMIKQKQASLKKENKAKVDKKKAQSVKK